MKEEFRGSPGDDLWPAGWYKRFWPFVLRRTHARVVAEHRAMAYQLIEVMGCNRSLKMERQRMIDEELEYIRELKAEIADLELNLQRGRECNG